ncbi:MAG: hypothetical protein PQ964_05565 [Methanobacteriaceae archaeon]|jgi:coproporphyrinogen III oxidase-like Fe-S oxidoreductase
MCECCEPVRGKKDISIPYMECNSIIRHRHFLSREEETEMLEKYIDELEKEIKGVKRRIQEIKA